MSKWTRKQRAGRATLSRSPGFQSGPSVGLVEAGPAEFSSITETDRYRMCSVKRAYSKVEARSQINQFNRLRRGRHGSPDSLRAYECPFCNRWHLTKENG